MKTSVMLLNRGRILFYLDNGTNPGILEEKE